MYFLWISGENLLHALKYTIKLSTPWKALSTQASRTRAAQKSPNWLFSVKVGEQWDTPMWQEEMRHRYPRTAQGHPRSQIPLALQLDYSSPIKSQERLGRPALLLSSHEEEWHSETFPNLLSPLSQFYDWCRTNRCGKQKVTKKHVITKQNPDIRRH